MKVFILITLLVIIWISAFGLILNCGDDDDDSRGIIDDDDDMAADDDTSADDDTTGDDDDDTSDDDTSDDDDEDLIPLECNEGICLDPNTGLMWMQYPTIAYGGTAEQKCEDLEWGTYSDWRVPTINEVRSLIRGCPATETGGSCTITDSCTDYSECFSQSCFGCDAGQGPDHAGCYLPDDFYPDGMVGCFETWAFPEGQWDKKGKEKLYWLISFGSGGFTYQDGSFNYAVNCVR